jgi:polysaccharide biosynthesis/export protein
MSEVPVQKHNPMVMAAMLLLAGTMFVQIISAPAAAQQALPDYTLQPGDEINVSVWREEDLQRDILVRPDGKFSFPLVGEIVAVNRTPAQVQAEITQKLLVYIPEAVVTVTVTGIEGNRVYLIGQVQRPGAIVMNPKINVLQALSIAGGGTPFASLNNIIIIRGRGADQRTLPFRYDDVARGRNLEQNVLLEAGDVIIVP